MELKNASLIISFYNNIDFLKLTLAGFERQTYNDFEIIIADDGSSNEIVEKLNLIIQNSDLDIKHVWHKDEGWRKNIILNKAIIKSNSDYLIFIDGDCIPHKSFIEEHVLNKRKGYFLAGRRVNLSKYISNKLTNEKILDGYLEKRYLLLSFLLKVINKGTHIENGVYIKSKFIRKRINQKDKGILGSNFSLFKEDLLAVNGFDERYIHPAAGEDTDLEYRLRNYGIKCKTVKHLAIQYHLFHKKLKRNKENLIILNENIRNKVTYTPFGIKKNKD